MIEKRRTVSVSRFVLLRVALAPAEIPLGIVTAFTGGPLFLYLLRRTKQGYRF